MADDLRAHLDPYLDSGAVDRLRAYFVDLPLYTGRYFERLDGGGDRPETADRLTSDDLVAVSMLSVKINPKVALAILEDRAAEFADLLADVPKRVDLWDVSPDVVGSGSPAVALWHGLIDIPDVAWVTAGKLLARKRPRLIPVYDDIVKAAVHAPADWWVELHTALHDEGLRDRLHDLRAESGVGEDISLLRILDVAIWMTKDYPLTS